MTSSGARIEPQAGERAKGFGGCFFVSSGAMSRGAAARARRRAEEAEQLARALSWPAARDAHARGAIGPAELAAVFVASRVRLAAGPRWLQGAPRERCAAADLPPVLALFAERSLHRVGPEVGAALVGLHLGTHPGEVVHHLPTTREMLAIQAKGRRFISLLEDAELPEGAHPYHHDGLSFAIHDLCHLDKFANPLHFRGQVGFFAALVRALEGPAWAALEAGFDATWAHERDHVLADMNGSPVFLFAALKGRLKLAVRREIAARRGEPCKQGDLDDGERRAYEDATERLYDALDLAGPARDAARALSSKRDGEGAAEVLTAHFEARGAGVEARQ